MTNLNIPISDELKEDLERYANQREISQAGAVRLILSETLPNKPNGEK